MIAEILETKRSEVEALKKAEFGQRPRPLRRPVFDRPVNIIAELKRRSPSAGFIREIDEERIDVYGRYAKIISVVTDSTYFGGSYDFLSQVAGSTSLPILCKDFIIDRVQIDRAYAAGADMVLLIARILPKEELESLYAYACMRGLMCLIELHGTSDMEKIGAMTPEMVGVNGRDLDTLGMDLHRVEEMLPALSAPFRVAESGIRSRSDVERMLKAGANGFLIGEALMRAENPERLFEELLNG